MEGFLLIDKPAGISSFGAVAKARQVISDRLGQKVKIGHTGTLDPMATGLLVLVVGSYTKRASELSKLDKTYQAEITLGAISSTGDSEGEVVKKSSLKPGLSAVMTILDKFIGQISQTPPRFSALKVNGQRAYKLARAGKEVKLEPRKINIYQISDVDYQYPKLKLTVEVSSGTYIRSLAEDIGGALGTGAYLSGLRRTAVAGFSVADAQELAGLTPANIGAHLKQGLPEQG